MRTWNRWLAAAAVALSAGPAAAVELTVTHWGALMYGAPFAVAKEKGYFAEEGIDVTGFITSKGGGTTLRNALASDIPYGEASLAAVVAAAQEGVDLTIVHAGVRSIGDILWITRKDADDIAGIDDLDGKAVSYTSPRSVSEMVLIMSLDAAGLGIDRVDPKALGGVGAGLTALSEGAVDSATVLEPIWTQVKDKYKPVFYAKDLLPDVAQTVGVVRTDYLEENAAEIEKIVRARMRGVDFIMSNPDEAGAILAKAYDLDPAVATEALKNVAAMDYWSRGNFEYGSMDNMVKGLQIVGAIPEGAFDWSTVVSEAYLPAELRAGN